MTRVPGFRMGEQSREIKSVIIIDSNTPAREAKFMNHLSVRRAGQHPAREVRRADCVSVRPSARLERFHLRDFERPSRDRSGET